MGSVHTASTAHLYPPLHTIFIKLIRLELEVLFYSSFIGIVFFHFSSDVNLLKILTPLQSNCYWFYSSYFLLYLISPFLNSFIKTIEKTDFRRLLVTIFFYLGCITILSKNSCNRNVKFELVYISLSMRSIYKILSKRFKKKYFLLFLFHYPYFFINHIICILIRHPRKMETNISKQLWLLFTYEQYSYFYAFNINFNFVFKN